MGDHSRIGDDFPEENQGVPVSLNREPALLWIGLIAPLVQAIAAFVFVTDPAVQGAVNAVAAALAGAVTAWLVKDENLVPILTGLGQAVIALVLAYGVQWSVDQQTALMAAFGVVAAFVVRERVTAPVERTVTA
jgi:hypothetical protein